MIRAHRYVAIHAIRGPAASVSGVILAALLIWTFVSTIGYSEEPDARTVAVRFAAAQIAQANLTLLAEWDAPTTLDALCEMILAEPAEHQEAKESQKILKRHYEDLLREKFHEGLMKVQEEYNGSNNDNPYYSPDWIETYVSEKLGPALIAAVQANVRRHYGQAFSGARASAVSRQMGKLTGSAYPNRETLVALDKARWSSDALARFLESNRVEMERSVNQPLLEEVENKVEILAQAALDDAKSQVGMQRKAIMRETPPADVQTLESIMPVLRRAVENVIATTKQDTTPGRVVYDMLPSLDSEIRSRALELEMERFISYSETEPSRVDKEMLRDLVVAELLANKQFERSLEFVSQQFFNSFTEACVYQHVQRATASERQSHLRRLEEAIGSDRKVRMSLDRILRKKISQPLTQARKQITEEQFSLFPALSSGTWQPPESFLSEFLMKWHGTRRLESALPNLSSCLALPEIPSGTENDNVEGLLEETEQVIVDACRRLMAEAQRAWVAQDRLVLRNEVKIRTEMYRAASEKEPEEWTVHFEGRIHEEWRRVRAEAVWNGAPPTARPDKYASLFKHTKDRIRQVVKDQYEVLIARNIVSQQRDYTNESGQVSQTSFSQAVPERPIELRPEKESHKVPQIPYEPASEKPIREKVSVKRIRDLIFGSSNSEAEMDNSTEHGGGDGSGDSVGNGGRGSYGEGAASGSVAPNSPVRSSAKPPSLWRFLLCFLLLLLLAYLLYRFLCRRKVWALIVSLSVQDLEESIRFYLKFEGTELTFHSHAKAILRFGNAYLELRRDANGSHTSQLSELSVLVHSIDHARARLAQENITVSPENDLHDPDGMLIRLLSTADFQEVRSVSSSYSQ